VAVETRREAAESGTFPANDFGQCRKACHQYAPGCRHVMMLVCFIVLSPIFVVIMDFGRAASQG
jgi:hypothetical protein